jgi:hypothetical protein
MKTNSKSNLTVAILCFILLFFPLLGMIFPAIDIAPNIIENRVLAEMPKLPKVKVTDFPEQFENFFNDHFGYRKFLIRQNSLLKHKILNTRDDEVLIGKDGWLFYTGDHSLENYQGANPFSFNQLQHWQNVLEKKSDWLKTQGIEYLFVVAPNKSSIYPEHLPEYIEKINNLTPLDQLTEHLKKHSRIQILDLRATLMTEKNKGSLLYTPSDTHWNHLGGFIAYTEIISQVRKIFPEIKPLTLDGLKVKSAIEEGGDLAKFLGTQEDTVERKTILLPFDSDAKTVFSTEKEPREVVMTTSHSELPRAVIFRDSFSEALIPYLSENFSYSRFIWSQWKNETPIEKIILESKPDIVIEEWVERYLSKMSKVSVSIGNH